MLWSKIKTKDPKRFVNVKLHMSHRVATRFRCMKRLEILLLPPGWDANPSQGYPQHYDNGTHFYTWVDRDNVE